MADDYLLGNVFNDFALLFTFEIGPAGVEVFRFGENLVARQNLDSHEIEFSLECGELVVELLEPLFQGLILTLATNQLQSRFYRQA